MAAGAYRPWQLLRFTSMVNSQGAAVRKRWLISNMAQGAMGGPYWGIASPVAHFEPAGEVARADQSYDEALVAGRIRTVRTDCDAFGEAEAAVLENHGYTLAEAACQRHAAHLLGRPDVPFRIPNPA